MAKKKKSTSRKTTKKTRKATRKTTRRRSKKPKLVVVRTIKSALKSLRAGLRKKEPRVVYYKPRQTGSVKSLDRDRARKALPPGKRISKSGRVYYEYRKNRSDKKGSKI